MRTLCALLLAALGLAPAVGATTNDGDVQLRGPDVSITVIAPKKVHRGAQLTYLVTVSNRGPETATDVVVTDQLFRHAAFVQLTRSQGSYGLELYARGATLTWELDALAPGEAARLFLIVRPTVRGRLASSAAVTAPGDPDATSNSARLSTAVV